MGRPITLVPTILSSLTSLFSTMLSLYCFSPVTAQPNPVMGLPLPESFGARRKPRTQKHNEQLTNPIDAEAQLFCGSLTNFGWSRNPVATWPEEQKVWQQLGQSEKNAAKSAIGSLCRLCTKNNNSVTDILQQLAKISLQEALKTETLADYSGPPYYRYILHEVATQLLSPSSGSTEAPSTPEPSIFAQKTQQGKVINKEKLDAFITAYVKTLTKAIETAPDELKRRIQSKIIPSNSFWA